MENNTTIEWVAKKFIEGGAGYIKFYIKHNKELRLQVLEYLKKNSPEDVGMYQHTVIEKKAYSTA